jgi:hypothetical protein
MRRGKGHGSPRNGRRRLPGTNAIRFRLLRPLPGAGAVSPAVTATCSVGCPGRGAIDLTLRQLLGRGAGSERVQPFLGL